MVALSVELVRAETGLTYLRPAGPLTGQPVKKKTILFVAVGGDDKISRWKHSACSN